MSPEVIKASGHSFAVDWWALGVIIYELIVGIKPFYTGGNNIEKMYNMIKTKEVQFPDKQRHTIVMSEHCKDFIWKLLDKNPRTRLGSNGDIDEILAHPWINEAKIDIRPYCKDCNEFIKTCMHCLKL